MRKLISMLFAVCVCAAQSVGQIAGPWHGEINVGAQRLPIVFNISEGSAGYAVTMDSPLQGAKGIPAEIDVAGDTVSISIPVIGAKYQGVCTDGSIEGTFEQQGIKFRLALEPGEYVAPRPQTPQPPYPYETREVTFANPVDGYQLHGTLTLPMLYNSPVRKTYNAVVMVTGSGIQNRDEEIYSHRPFAVIAHALAMDGIASLRYDDRGYGDDAAAVSTITTASNTSDAKAAIDYVRGNVERISKVGALGHSEGGTIALILGAEGEADFVVSLAGSALQGDSILMLQNERLLRDQLPAALTMAYLKGLRRVLDFMQSNPQAREWPEFDTAMADLELPAQLSENLKTIISTRNAWLDYFVQYDPSDDIRRVGVPVYAANGTLDAQVDCRSNLGALRSLLPGNPKTVVREYPGLNHLMQEARTGLPSEYGEIEQTVSPELLRDIGKWIKSLK